MQIPSQHSIAPYSVAAFNALPEFNESKSRFGTQCHVLDDLAKIIRSHGLQKYLGAALIHKHYSLCGQERMVEEVASTGSVLAPRVGVVEDSVIPYLWHVNPRLQWTPVEFVVATTVPIDVRQFSCDLSKETLLLHELATAIVSASARDTFGLALLHRQHIGFDRRRQVLLESPGPTDRSLMVKPVNPDVTDSADWTQTYWHFDIDDDPQSVACSQHGCAGYCSLH